MVQVYDTPSGKGLCGACAEDVGPCEGEPCVNARDRRDRQELVAEFLANPDFRFLNDVTAELARARKKFPSSYLVLAALTEEVGELAQAMLYERAGKGNASGKDPKRHVWDEAVQVAAMALRVAVEGDPSFAASPYSEP